MNIKLPGFGTIRQWLFNLVLAGIKKMFASEGARAHATTFGTYVGRALGQIIPGEHVDGFLAAFARGFAVGLDETDTPGAAVRISVEQAAKQNLGNS